MVVKDEGRMVEGRGGKEKGKGGTKEVGTERKGGKIKERIFFP